MNGTAPLSAPAPNLDWDLVRAFLAVADAGSLTAAAAQSSASQPTLSRQVAELERRLGTPLFERLARGLRLTPAGEALLAPARQMQGAAEALGLAARHHTSQLAGTVRITAADMTSAYILPPILADLRRRHPEIEIELAASNRIQNLLERDADIAVRHARPTQTGLVARRLGRVKIGAFARRDYLRRVGGEVDLKRLGDYDWIGYDRSDILLRGFRKAGIPVEREFFRLRSDNHFVCWQAALAGAGICFAPARVGAAYPEMRSVLPEAMVPPLALWLVAHREVRSTVRIRRVFDVLAEGLQEIAD